MKKIKPLIIPCIQNPKLKKEINEFAEVLKSQSHTLGNHGLDEKDFYQGGLFRGAIERIRGQFAATMKHKRELVALILNHMVENGAIKNWSSTGGTGRYDYQITLNSERIAIIELKGCLDGNNTNIFTRPVQADEFVIWSLCQNQGADPRANAWSGIHTRLSAEVIDRNQVVDGLIIWDMYCGTISRPCPKLLNNQLRITKVGSFELPPPCIYLFPATVPHPIHNSEPKPQSINEVEILKAFHKTFKGHDKELTEVYLEVKNIEKGMIRITKLVRDHQEIIKSEPTLLKRT